MVAAGGQRRSALQLLSGVGPIPQGLVALDDGIEAISAYINMLMKDQTVSAYDVYEEVLELVAS